MITDPPQTWVAGGRSPGPVPLAGITAGHRVIACALISDPASAPRTVVASPTAVAQRIDDHTVLVTVLADDAATATRHLAALCARSQRKATP